MKLLLETLNYEYDAPTDTHTAIIGIIVPDEYRNTIHLELHLHHQLLDDEWWFVKCINPNKEVVVDVTQDQDKNIVKIRTKSYTWILFTFGNLVVCTELAFKKEYIRETREIVTLDAHSSYGRG